MSNIQKTNSLGKRPNLRTLAALSLALSLAAFGCSTNHTPGNGEPIYLTPAGGSSAPTPSVTPGTSSGSSVPTTMVSGGVDRSVDAIAVLRANEAYRGVVLGPLNPAPLTPTSYAQRSTGQFISPSVYANPQMTVNTSISSDAVPAIGVDGVTVALPSAEGATVGAATVGTSAVAGTQAIVASAPLTNARNAAATPLLTTIGVGPVAITSAARSSGTINTGTLTASPRVSVSAPIRIDRSAGVATVSNVSSPTP